MTRNLYFLFSFFLFFPSLADAADSPILLGYSGAGRAGVPRESLFGNPAALALLTNSSSFLYFTKPKIPEYQAGGRAYSIGAYDGENEYMKGGIAYIRNARARLAGNQQIYDDRSEIRFSGGRAIWGNIFGGFSGRYITKNNGPVQETKFFQGDAGLIFPLFNEVRAGVTYENLMEKDGEAPPSLGAGLKAEFGFGMQLLGDMVRVLRGAKKGENSHAIAAEINLAGDLFFRGGRFRDVAQGKNGWSLGASWTGPRTSFDYALRMTKGIPHEKDHVFGINVAF